MAVVNRFNVNKQQVTLDADIIENMSANDVSYDASFQYDENTVGDKLSELESEVTYLDIQSILIDVTNCEIYKEGYYISNGAVGLLGEERVSSIGVSIVRSLGWKKGQQIIINRIDAGGSSTCAVATYNNGAFVGNLISGNGGGGYLPDVPYTFTPDYDFDEIRLYMEEIKQKYNIRIKELCFDPANATLFINQLEKEYGYKCVEIRQGALTLNEPTKDLRSCVFEDRVRHPKNDGLMDWTMGNCVTYQHKQEWIMLDKKRSAEKIDPIAAMVDAHTRGMKVLAEKKNDTFYVPRRRLRR